MTLPQHVEPGGAQMGLLSHVRHTRSAAQATAPQQEEPDGLHTGNPPQLSSTMSPGQSACAHCAGRITAHAATTAAITSPLRSHVMVGEFLPRAGRLSTDICPAGGTVVAIGLASKLPAGGAAKVGCWL